MKKKDLLELVAAALVMTFFFCGAMTLSVFIAFSIPETHLRGTVAGLMLIAIGGFLGWCGWFVKQGENK